MARDFFFGSIMMACIAAFMGGGGGDNIEHHFTAMSELSVLRYFFIWFVKLHS